MDLETGCSKLAIVNVLGILYFKRPQYIQITTIDMYLFIKIRYDILIHCHGNYIQVKKSQLYAFK